jgi:hypothetical protein
MDPELAVPSMYDEFVNKNENLPLLMAIAAAAIGSALASEVT